MPSRRVGRPAGRPQPPAGPGGRRPGLQAALALALYLGAQLLATVIASSYVVAALIPQLIGDGPLEFTLSPDDPLLTGVLLTITTDPIAASLFFSTYAITSLAGFALILRWLARRDFFVTFRLPGAWSELGWGILIGGLLIAVGINILLLLGVYRGSAPGPDPGIVAGLMLALGAAVAEEVFLRGFLLRLLNARFGSTIAVAAVSLAFGLVHAISPGAGWTGAAAAVVSSGLLLCSSYLLTRRLWLPLGIHFAWNAMQAAVYGVNLSGSGSGRGYWAGELTGPDWLSGGSMGAEGSVVIIGLGLLAGVGFTLAAVRSGRWRSLRTARAQVAASRSLEREQRLRSA